MQPIGIIPGTPTIELGIPSNQTISPILQNDSNTLLPLVQMGPDNEIIWNLDQNPLLLHDCTFEDQIFTNISNAIKQRSDFILSESPEKLKELLENFGLRICSWNKAQPPGNPQTYQEEIQTIEELFVRCDICISSPVKNFQVEIGTEQQAYVLFLFCVYAGYIGEFETAQKLLGVIKKYKNSRELDFGQYPLIKKLSIHLLAKCNPKLALELVNSEIAKSSSPSTHLLLTKGFILKCLNNEIELSDHLKLLEASASSSIGFLQLKSHLNYSVGNWSQALKTAETLLDLNPEEPLGLEDLQYAYILSRIYRFGSSFNHSDTLSKRFKKTLATIDQSHLVTKLSLINTLPSIALNLYLSDESSKNTLIEFLKEPLGAKILNLQVILSVVNVLIKASNQEKVDESELTKATSFNLGDVHFALFTLFPATDVKNRVHLLDRTLQSDANHLDALFEQSLIDLKALNWSRALASVSICINRAIDPKPDWLLIHAICCTNLGQHPKAIDLSYKYTKKKPEDPDGWHELGYNFIMLKDIEKGRSYNDMALTRPNLMPEVRLSMLTRIIEIDPTYPRILEEAQRLMGTKKSIEIEAGFIKANWYLQNKQMEEIKPLLKFLPAKDQRYTILLAQIAIYENKLNQALEITRQYIRKEKNCCIVLKYRLGVLLKAECYTEFKTEFIRYIAFKPTQDECVATIELYVKILLDKKQINRALELCEKVIELFPSNRKIAKLRVGVQTFAENPLLLNLAQTTTASDLEKRVDTCNLNMDSGQEFFDSHLSDLKVLVKVDNKGNFAWDFDQNDWDLDSATWLRQLQNVFHRDAKLKNPTLLDIGENLKVQVEEITNHLRIMVDIVIEQITSLMESKKNETLVKPIGNFPQLLNSLYVSGMFHEINQALSLATRPLSSKFFSASDMVYIQYVNFVVACKNKDVPNLSKSLTYFEQLKLLEPNMFFEKLKTLIFIAIPEGNSNLEKPPGKTLERIDKSLALIKNNPKTSSLYILKAGILASSHRLEECAALLDELDPLIKNEPEYLKLKCLTNFVSRSFTEVQEIGEAYFTSKPDRILDFSDLQVAFILSTVYRYKETKSNGDLYTRLLNTLSDPKCWLFPNQNSYEIFLHIVFNFISNKACADFDSQKIVLFDTENILMQTAKETILYWWSELHSTSFIKRNILLEDPRIKGLVERVEPRIKKENCAIPDVLYEKALASFNKKDYAKGLEYLNALHSLTPVHLEALFLRAKILFINEEFSEALVYIRTCINRNTKYHPDWTLLYSSCLLKLKKFDEFITVIEIACREEPENNYVHMAHFDALIFVNRLKEGLEAAQKILRRSLIPKDRLYVLKKLVQRMENIESSPVNASTGLSTLQDNISIINSQDDEETKREVFGLYCLVNLKFNEIAEAKLNAERYGKNDITGLFIQASIEFAEKKYEEALATVKKCLKMIPKSYNSDLVFDFDLSAEIKALRIAILYNLNQHRIVNSDPLEWIVASSPDFIALQAFDYYIKSCIHIDRLEDAAKACEKLHKAYPSIVRLEEIKKLVLQLMVEKKRIVAKTELSSLPQLKVDKEEIGEKVSPILVETVEVKVTKIIKPDFIYEPKPDLERNKGKEISKYTLGCPVHPAFLKIQKHTLDEAQLIIDAMYEEDPTQLEVGLKMSEIMKRLEVKELLEAKPAPRPPKEAPKPPAPKENTLAPSAAPVIVPKDHLKPLNTALMSMSEIRKHLSNIKDLKAQVDPIYRNQAFASRLLSYHLFRVLELLKSSKKTASLTKFKDNVQNVFTEWKDVQLLRNLMALHGHRTSLDDLITFCQRLVSGFAFENLECLTKGQTSRHPPLELKIEILFPIAFKYEWVGLEAEEKKNTLLKIINLELDFVAEMHEKYNPEVFFIKGTDVREVLKGSVLRIGKAFSRLNNELGIVIEDPELIGIREASKRVRHQILDNSVMSEELQSKWLLKFMQSHARVRDKVDKEIPRQVARSFEKSK